MVDNARPERPQLDATRLSVTLMALVSFRSSTPVFFAITQVFGLAAIVETMALTSCHVIEDRACACPGCAGVAFYRPARFCPCLQKTQTYMH